MKQIDKLIIRAKDIASKTGPHLYFAMIARCGDSWTSEAHLTDEVQGHAPSYERATHATQGDAIEHIHTLAEKYPNGQDVVIIIDDV